MIRQQDKLEHQETPLKEKKEDDDELPIAPPGVTKRSDSAQASMAVYRKSLRKCNSSKAEAIKIEETDVAQQKGTFVDSEEMKKKVREKLSKPKYQVTDLYYEEGICQMISRSGLFDKATLAVIAFNALWIAIDTDMNHAALLFEADTPFIAAENFFCVFFSFEWVMRFLSFRRKLDGFKDGWFAFDTMMVTMMVLETWVFSLVVFLAGGEGSSGGNTGIMRLARLLRLTRMARMGKLLRVMPELMIMIKGMKAATRSVFFTLVLLVVIMYVYAIALVQLSKDTEIGNRYFDAVPSGMYTLVIFGIFLDNVGMLTSAIEDEWVLGFLIFSFILLGALTVMNMLVGVLCEVVSAVAATEQEEMLVTYVNEKISRVMLLLDADGGGSISKKEFMQILENVEAVRCLNDVGVDVFALCDLADYIFEDDNCENDEEVELDFSRFMDVVLQLRGTNQATVRDIVDLRKFIRQAMKEHYNQTKQILEKLSEGAKASAAMMQKFGPADGVTENGTLQPSKMAGHTYYSSVDSSQKELLADELAGNSDLTNHAPKVGDHFDVGPFHEVNGSLPPSPPRMTPNGQLLHWIPVVDPDYIPPAGYAFTENVTLTGSWSQLDGNGLETEVRIPMEADPLRTSKGAAVSSNHIAREYLHNGQSTKWTDFGSEIAIKIPRLHTVSAGAEDPELEALQLHLKTICGQLATQLAAGLNDVVDLAGKSFKKNSNGMSIRESSAAKADQANAKLHPSTGVIPAARGFQML